MSQYAFYPSSAAGNASVGTNGSTAPTSSTEVGGIDNLGNLHPLQTNAAGELLVSIGSEPGAPFHVIVDSSALPTGASTSALQTTGNTSLASIDAKLTAPITVTGPLTDAQLRATPVPVSGTVTVVQPTGASLHVDVDSSALPAGAATAANQATEIASLASIDAKLTSPITVTGPLTDVQLRASAVPVSVASLPLPSGAATSANQSTEIASLASIDGKLAENYGVSSGALRTAAQVGNASGSADFGAGAAGAQTLRVVAASGGAAPSPATGRAFSNAPARNDYSSVNVTTAAYVQLVASTTSATNLVEVFDSSGQTLALAVGAAASEVIQFYIFPGGNGPVPLAIPASSRVSIKAISATASVGEIDVNFYS